jgi:hypothetical protein
MDRSFGLKYCKEQCKEELHGGTEPSNAINVEAQRWDPRGLAVKFYKREGKFELVGNNILVFFIRGGIKVCLFGSYTKLHSSYF